MRIVACTLFTLAACLLSLIEGTAVSLSAFVLCYAGSMLIANKHLKEFAANAEEPRISIRVVRWNY